MAGLLGSTATSMVDRAGLIMGMKTPLVHAPRQHYTSLCPRDQKKERGQPSHPQQQLPASTSGAMISPIEEDAFLTMVTSSSPTSLQ
mmetsp:Transcript_7556/g.16335  ORF Transcript_7556/g.16335 Transcript_7556/m.16335 type:complete len:87 (+) Transcript_7556:159-419(+)